MTCRNCKRENHPAYNERYAGYCLDCFNAGIHEKDDEIVELEQEVLSLKEELDSLRGELDSLRRERELASFILRRIMSVVRSYDA